MCVLTEFSATPQAIKVLFNNNSNNNSKNMMHVPIHKPLLYPLIVILSDTNYCNYIVKYYSTKIGCNEDSNT